jgi:hypothetical protein
MLRQRKRTVVAIGENLAKEIKFDLKLVLPSGVEPVIADFDDFLKCVKLRDAEWFNTDKNLKEEMIHVFEKKDRAISLALKNWKRDHVPSTEASCTSSPLFSCTRIQSDTTLPQCSKLKYLGSVLQDVQRILIEMCRRGKLGLVQELVSRGWNTCLKCKGDWRTVCQHAARSLQSLQRVSACTKMSAVYEGRRVCGVLGM